MKISRVIPTLIKVPLKFVGTVPMVGNEARRELHTLLVTVETDEGITGYGEAYAGFGPMASFASIQHVIAPRCIGRDPTHIAQIMHDLFRGLYFGGRSGPVVYALSAIDIALWDIAGKCAQLPLYRLLGGASRRSLPAYASLMRYEEVSTVTYYVQQALDRGYRLIKLHENTLDTIRAARHAAGPSVPLMVDCLSPWNFDEALAMSRRLADLDITWLEEPLYPPDDHAGLARLRSASSIPIAAGENVSNLFEFRRLFEAGALSIAQPSVIKVGGISELKKICALAESFGVPAVPHSPYFGPGFLASLHVCAAMAREVWIERYYCDFDSNPYGEAIEPQQGNIRIPQTPGLGFEPDPVLIEQLRVA